MPNPIRQVSDLENSIAGILTGTDLDDVTNIYGAIERTAREIVQKIKPPEAVGRYFFNLYSGVYDYPVDSRIFGTSIIDLRPQGVSRTPIDYAYKDNIADFDRSKKLARTGYKVTFEYTNGTPVLRAATPKTLLRATIDPCNATTGWSTGGSASALTADSANFYEQPASLSFNLANGGNQGYIEKTLPNPVNLTGYLQPGVVFIPVELPSAVDINSIGIHLGNNSSVYLDVSATTGFLGTFVSGQYLIVALNLSAATQVGGTVDLTKIQYARVYVNYDGVAQSGIHIGGIWASLPSPVQLIYTTAALFLDFTTGLLKQKISSPNDYIILSDSAYTLFEYESAITVALQNGGTLSSGIVASIGTKLNGARTRTGQVIEYGLYDLYRADNPTQEIHTIGNWYDDVDD